MFHQIHCKFTKYVVFIFILPASSTPSIVFHDFAQIIQDMRNGVYRRVAKRVVKDKPTPVIKKKIIVQEPNRVYKCKRCDIVFETKVCHVI